MRRNYTLEDQLGCNGYIIAFFVCFLGIFALLDSMGVEEDVAGFLSIVIIIAAVYWASRPKKYQCPKCGMFTRKIIKKNETGRTYLHTKLNGTPDYRYKNNYPIITYELHMQCMNTKCKNVFRIHA
jgi:hypothetical protein